MSIELILLNVTTILNKANIKLPIIFSLLREGSTYYIHITFNSNLTIAYSPVKATYLYSGDFYNQFLMMKNIKDSDMQLVLEEMTKLCQSCSLSISSLGDKPFVYKMNLETGMHLNMSNLSYIDELEELDK